MKGSLKNIQFSNKTAKDLHVASKKVDDLQVHIIMVYEKQETNNAII